MAGGDACRGEAARYRNRRAPHERHVPARPHPVDVRGIPTPATDVGYGVVTSKPWLIRLPAAARNGHTSATPIMSIDILSTALAAAGVPLPTGLKIDAIAEETPNHAASRLGWCLRDGFHTHGITQQCHEWQRVDHADHSARRKRPAPSVVRRICDVAREATQVCELIQRAWSATVDAILAKLAIEQAIAEVWRTTRVWVYETYVEY